ncbi:MAG TPA: type II toxin-antitoxin system prevent-host-death family antitoxin [Ramlibacter sp.]|nr:type II toxin-antitoxin system prevent-host-death family antitoxin [Ramlibacter sp.]
MEAVGLFEAKTHLSEYVARAEAGEEVVIMRHNKPVAKIVPLSAAGDRSATFDAQRRQQVLQAALQAKAEWSSRHGAPKPALSAAVVRELRADR